MGVRITAEDSDAESVATEYSSPVRRGLQEIHFLNTSTVKAAHNYAPDKKSGAVVGSPVASSDRLSMVGLTSYIQTDMAEPAEMTVYIVARSGDNGSSNATRPAFFGTYAGLGADGGYSYGTTLYFSDASNIAANAGFGNTVSDHQNIRATIPITDAAKWALYEYIVDATGVYLRDVTNNRSGSNTAVGALPRRPTTNRLRIGSAFNNLAGTCDVALFQAHSVRLNDIERAAVIADLRARALDRGITV